MELTEEILKTGFLQSYNEKALEKHYKTLSADSTYPQANKSGVQTSNRAPHISLDELEEESNLVAESLRAQDYEFIQKFYDEYDRAMTEEELAQNLEGDPVARIQSYLESELPHPRKLREFLGKDVDLRDLSQLLVQEVGAMTAARRWRSTGGDSIQRAFLTALNNDMNKKRYVASVLFFGGRCCYCNRVLNKRQGSNVRATGEHITPIAPENENDVVGSTRYGNMALACFICNKSRGNKELVSWIQDNHVIRLRDRGRVLGRIKAFREFALYEDYTPEESSRIRESIARVQKYAESLRNPDGTMPADGGAKVRSMIGSEIYAFGQHNHGEDDS